jgi:cytochrome b subunit of formate dehydrogenase
VTAPARGFISLLVLLSAALALSLAAPAEKPKPLPGSEPCAACHDAGRRAKREAGMPPNFDAAALQASPHAGQECTACHADLAKKELPHAEKLAKVDCGGCHPDQQTQYEASLHGRAVGRGDKLAPTCKSCHGTHNVLRPSAPNSPTSTMQIPKLCGGCHREGTPVSQTRNIPQTNILGNYMDSIHGEGLFKRGLTVTAVCTSCHTSHFVLPHTDNRSSIAKNNISKTCTKCHAQIETVHRKVIRGELWEKGPHLIPACVDCHEPHKVRRVFYAQGMSDRDCQRCHGDPSMKATAQATSRPLMAVDQAQLAKSRHARVACVQCHTGGTPSEVRPCRTMTQKVDCSICHADAVTQYRESTHGKLFAENSPDAPTCRDCHAPHATLGKNDSSSPTFSRNIPALCGSCHRTGNKASNRYKGTQDHVLEHYSESIHGKGLLQSGLTVTADCVDCHTAHHELPSKDPRSSVNRANIARTCSQCHRGIFEMFTSSVHSPGVTKTSKLLPECADCHSAHSIQRTDLSNFRLHIMDQCGRCHKEITDRYFDTFHGKVSTLGYLKTAKCYDCHGAHDILPVNNPRSRLSRANIVNTCGKCHSGSHRQFAGYLTHATHHDPVRYPFLFYTFWGMTTLLVGTLVVSGAHTVMWLKRSLEFRKTAVSGNGHAGAQYVRRFRPFDRNLHLMVVSSFLGLALTGMTLKFSYAPWAKVLARLLGGFEGAGLIHRFCAVITFTYFALHIWDLVKSWRASGKTLGGYIFGPESMMFNRRDWDEFAGSMKWFAHRGPRPEYGRWTYWEKFDYFAVFWGVAVIGGTGLLLWFPELFTRVLPGWMVNVATTIHSDEALLAVSFIFVVHFFNTHFRPEKFPIDTVIFTTGMPLEEFKEDRPREYQQLVESGKLEELLIPDPSPRDVKFWKRIGFTALTIGLVLIGLILYAAVFAYR